MTNTISVDEILKLVTEMKSNNFGHMKNPYGYRSDEEWRFLEGKEEAFEEVIEAIENFTNTSKES